MKHFLGLFLPSPSSMMLYFTDTNVQVACLTCYGAVISIFPSHKEVECWLAGVGHGDAAATPWLLQHCFSLLQLQSKPAWPACGEEPPPAMCPCDVPVQHRLTGSSNGGLADFGCPGKVLLPPNQWLLDSTEGFLPLALGLFAFSCPAACLKGETVLLKCQLSANYATDVGGVLSGSVFVPSGWPGCVLGGASGRTPDGTDAGIFGARDTVRPSL